MPEPSPYTVEALMRGLKVLSLFNRERSALSFTEIVEASGLNKSTAFRVVATLESAGYLDRHQDTRRYQPGLKVLQLGFTAISSLEFRQVARPHLVKLSEETGETVSLSILDGMEVVYVDRVRNRQIVGVVLGIGSRIPAHCASMGKVMLAHLEASELESRLNRVQLIPCTEFSKVNRKQLDAELASVRARGFATNNEELEIGVRAVSAPIWDHNGHVAAAINTTGSVRTISTDRLHKQLAKQVCDTALQISQALGYQM